MKPLAAIACLCLIWPQDALTQDSGTVLSLIKQVCAGEKISTHDLVAFEGVTPPFNRPVKFVDDRVGAEHRRAYVLVQHCLGEKSPDIGEPHIVFAHFYPTGWRTYYQSSAEGKLMTATTGCGKVEGAPLTCLQLRISIHAYRKTKPEDILDFEEEKSFWLTKFGLK